MALTKTDKIWMNGHLVPWDQANIHILSHVIHYGSCIFEGVRCYDTSRGPAVFRLQDHIRDVEHLKAGDGELHSLCRHEAAVGHAVAQNQPRLPDRVVVDQELPVLERLDRSEGFLQDRQSAI